MIPLSTFIACVVVLIICLLVVITAFVYILILYKKLKTALPAAVSSSNKTTSASNVDIRINDYNKELSTAPYYEALRGRNENESETYQQLQRSGSG